MNLNLDESKFSLTLTIFLTETYALFDEEILGSFNMKVIEITAVFFSTAPSAVGPRHSLRHRRLF